MTSSEDLSIFQRRMIVSIVLAASFLSVFMQFLLITAFPKIMIEFQIDASEVQWLTTSYMLAFAVLIPMTAYLIDRFKLRTLIISALFLFFLGTLIGLFSPSFKWLLLGRMVQGIGSGILMPLMQTVLLLVYPRKKRGYAMGLAGLVINVAPAIGPPISGLILNYYDWRTLFIVTLPIVAIILLFSYLFMKNITEQKETKIDIFSIILSTIGFGGILYGVNTIGNGTIGIVVFVMGGLALSLFVVRQFKLKLPILNLRVLKAPIFVLAIILSILSFSLLISIETIIPMYVQNVQQLSPLISGYVVAPGALTLAFMSLYAGSLFDKYGSRMISIMGFLLLTVSTLCYFLFLGLSTSLVFTSALFILSMAGVGLINMPIVTAGMNALPNSLIAHGTSVINTARQFGGSIGLTFIVSFMSNTAVSEEGLDPSIFLTGVKTSFLVALLFAVLGFFLSFLLKKE